MALVVVITIAEHAAQPPASRQNADRAHEPQACWLSETGVWVIVSVWTFACLVSHTNMFVDHQKNSVLVCVRVCCV
jgi:hypothetical protein